MRTAKQSDLSCQSLCASHTSKHRMHDGNLILFSRNMDLIVCPAGGTLLLLFFLQIHSTAKDRLPPSLHISALQPGLIRCPALSLLISAPTVTTRSVGPFRQKRKERWSCFLWAALHCPTTNEAILSSLEKWVFVSPSVYRCRSHLWSCMFLDRKDSNRPHWWFPSIAPCLLGFCFSNK